MDEQVKQTLQSLVRLVRVGAALTFAVVLITIVADWAGDRDWSLIAAVVTTYALGVVIIFANISLFLSLFPSGRRVETSGQALRSVSQLVRAGVASVFAVVGITVVADWATNQDWSLIVEVLVTYVLGAVIIFVNIRLFEPFLQFGLLSQFGSAGGWRRDLEVVCQYVRAVAAFVPAVVLTTIVADWAVGQDWSTIAEALTIYALGVVIASANICLFRVFFPSEEEASAA